MQEAREKCLVVIEDRGVPQLAAPKLIADASAAAEFAWEAVFIGKIRNAYTRRAYLHAVRRFLTWIEVREVKLARITPGLVGQYFDELDVSTPTKKLYLSGIRAFFDVLGLRHVMMLNPAHSVRMERYAVTEGKTPAITVGQAKALLGSIKMESVLDFRDRALIATLIYTAARAGAVGKLRLKDFAHDRTQFVLRFAEKGGKARSIPVRANLQKFVREYLFAAALEGQPKDAPLFRTASGRKARLSDKPMNGVDICRLVKRRLRAAGLPTVLSPHSFRSCAATDLLRQQIPLHEIQYLLGHSDARTTRLYLREEQSVTRNLVERISV